MPVTGPSSAIVTACETPFQRASDRAVSLKEPLRSYTILVQNTKLRFLDRFARQITRVHAKEGSLQIS